MIKGEQKLFSRILVVVILIFIINIGVFVVKFGDIDDGSEAINQTGFTGHSIGGDVAGLYLNLPLVSKIFLIVQWGLLALLLIYIGFRDKEVTKNQTELSGINLNQIRKKSETDLDALYNLLKQKQHLRVSTVSQAFDIKEDLAMEWGKILESGNLAYIDYPKFGGPLIKIKSKLISEENIIQKKEQIYNNLSKKPITSTNKKNNKGTEKPQLKKQKFVKESKQQSKPLEKVMIQTNKSKPLEKVRIQNKKLNKALKNQTKN